MFAHVSRLARSIALVAVILLIQSGSTFFALSANAQAESTAHHPFIAETSALPSVSSAMKANSDPYTLFLPVIFNQFPPLQTIFGAGMGDLNTSSGFNKMVQAGLFWARTEDVVSWANVEPEEGTRNWSVLATLAQGWQTASSLGIQPIVVVRVAPSWAQPLGETGNSCGPIDPGMFGAFASFMHDLVARYSVAPYNVKYWEIWNEPDIDYRTPGLPPNSDWGCLGNQDDPYYGGGSYETMLADVYPQIKSADAQAQVLVGGLLLDCDPRPGAGCAKVGHSNLPSKFLEGILRNSGTSCFPCFDGISFHSYDFYQGQLGDYSNANWQSAWNTTGPDITAKAEFIKSLMKTYKVSGKFLMNTESGIIISPSDNCDGDLTFKTTKAYYVAQAYAVAVAEGLRANLWYSVLGWDSSCLLNPDLSTQPAYTAFQVSHSELLASTLVGALTPSDIGGSTKVMGYKFNRGDRRIWVVWSLDGSSHSITPILGTPLAVVDALGSAVTPARTLTVGLDPLYLEWIP